MIHAHLVEGLEGDERDRVNSGLLARAKRIEEVAQGPVTLAEPGKAYPVPEEWKRRAVNPMVAALSMGGGG